MGVVGSSTRDLLGKQHMKSHTIISTPNPMNGQKYNFLNNQFRNTWQRRGPTDPKIWILRRIRIWGRKDATLAGRAKIVRKASSTESFVDTVRKVNSYQALAKFYRTSSMVLHCFSVHSLHFLLAEVRFQRSTGESYADIRSVYTPPTT